MLSFCLGTWEEWSRHELWGGLESEMKQALFELSLQQSFKIGCVLEQERPVLYNSLGKFQNQIMTLDRVNLCLA